MALYEYHCPKCDTSFEQFLPMSRAGETVKCPKCKGKAERTLTTFTARTPRGDRGPAGTIIMRSVGSNRPSKRGSSKSDSK